MGFQQHESHLEVLPQRGLRAGGRLRRMPSSLRVLGRYAGALLAALRPVVWGRAAAALALLVFGMSRLDWIHELTELAVARRG